MWQSAIESLGTSSQQLVFEWLLKKFLQCLQWQELIWVNPYLKYSIKNVHSNYHLLLYIIIVKKFLSFLQLDPKSWITSRWQAWIMRSNLTKSSSLVICRICTCQLNVINFQIMQLSLAWTVVFYVEVKCNTFKILFTKTKYNIDENKCKFLRRLNDKIRFSCRSR